MNGRYEIRHARDHRGRNPYQAFKDSLNADCFAQLLALERLLNANGPRCSPKLSKPLKGSNLWELRKSCTNGEVRIYYWRSGQLQFTFATGEIKKGKSPSQTTLDEAEQLYSAYHPR